MLQQNERSSGLPVQLTGSKMVWRFPADFMALCILPRFAIFYCQVLYFQFFLNFHIFTLK